MKEMERRFLIVEGEDPTRGAVRVRRIVQSYLSDTGGWAIRVRREEEAGEVTHVMTLKYPGMDDEYEPPITREMYDDLRRRCGHEVVKDRYDVLFAGRIWEIDVFHDATDGLGRVAEVELPSWEAPLEKPAWAGQEVTGDRWYSNQAKAARITEQNA